MFCCLHTIDKSKSDWSPDIASQHYFIDLQILFMVSKQGVIVKKVRCACKRQIVQHFFWGIQWGNRKLIKWQGKSFSDIGLDYFEG